MPLISIFIAFAAWFSITHADCYFPGRTPANRDTPCNNGPGPSACCSEDATCLANGACLNGGRISRGSCTDINWNSTACFENCRELSPYGGANIIPCPSNTGEWVFACGLNNCSEPAAIFTMPYDIANDLILRPTQLSSAASLAGSSLVAIPTNTSSGTPTSTPQADDDTFSAGAMAGVGVGIGVPLLIIIGVLSWLLLLEKKKSKQSAARDSSMYAAGAQGPPHFVAQSSSHTYAARSPGNPAEMAVKSDFQELEGETR